VVGLHSLAAMKLPETCRADAACRTEDFEVVKEKKTRHSVAVTVVLALLATAVPSAVGAECLRVKLGSGGSSQTAAFGSPFTGGAALRMEGGEMLVADVAVMLLGMPVPRPTHLKAKTLH